VAKGIKYFDVAVTLALAGEVIWPVVDETFMGNDVVKGTGTAVVGTTDTLKPVGNTSLMSVVEESSW